MQSFQIAIIDVIVLSLGMLAWLLFKARRGAGRPSLLSRRPPASPRLTQVRTALGEALRDLTFRDALHFERASEQIQGKLIAELNQHLSPGLADAAVVSVQLVSLASENGKYLAEFPKHVQKMIDTKDAILMVTHDGRQVLEAVDRSTGQILAHGNVVAPGLASRLAQASTLVVGAAHLIAGYDNAKKLKQIDKKVDLILTGRSNELGATLSAIYESTREALCSHVGDPDPSHLQNLKFELKRVRATWLADLRSHLMNISNPESRSWLAKFFSRDKSTAKDVSAQLSATEEALYLVRFALQLEQILAAALGQEEVFESVTLQDLRREVSDISTLVKERKQWIEKLNSDAATASEEFAAACERFVSSLQTTSSSYAGGRTPKRAA